MKKYIHIKREDREFIMAAFDVTGKTVQNALRFDEVRGNTDLAKRIRKLAKEIDANVTNSLIDNVVHQYAWYAEVNDYGQAAVTQVNNTCCLGYEDIYGHKYDMMDGVDLPNDSGNQGKWRIRLPDGGTMMVKGKTQGGWTAAVAHGKWMAVVPVGTVNGSNSTYYSDYYEVNTSAGRVVYRGCSHASADGGVSYANAHYGASYAGTNIGSRLAFRGKLVRAGSVAAYKALSEEA